CWGATMRHCFRVSWVALGIATLSGCRSETPPAPSADALRVQQLVTDLGSSDKARRTRAIRELGDLGPEAAPAIEHLIKAANDPEPNVRWLVCATFGKIGDSQDKVITSLDRALSDPNSDVRVEAIYALRRLIRRSEQATASVTKALANRHAD